jgi:hypothetical protein
MHVASSGLYQSIVIHSLIHSWVVAEHSAQVLVAVDRYKSLTRRYIHTLTSNRVNGSWFKARGVGGNKPGHPVPKTGYSNHRLHTPHTQQLTKSSMCGRRLHHICGTAPSTAKQLVRLANIKAITYLLGTVAGINWSAPFSPQCWSVPLSACKAI